MPRILWKKLIGQKVEEFTAKVSEGLSTRTEDLVAAGGLARTYIISMGGDTKGQVPP